MQIIKLNLLIKNQSFSNINVINLKDKEIEFEAANFIK